jgi:hypothetical protein
MIMAEKMERWLVQVVVPVGSYSGADEMIEDLTELVEFNSEIEVVSAELDPDQEMEAQ